MFRFLCAALLAVSLLVSGPAAAAPSPADVFAAPGAWTDISLSPSGNRVAVVGWKDSKHAIRVYEVGNFAAGPTAEYVLGPAPRVAWLDWKTDGRLLLGLHMIDETFADQAQGLLVTRTMLLVTDAKLKVFANPLTRPRSATAMPQYHDDIRAMLPQDRDHVLLQIDWHTPFRPSIYRLNIRTYEATKHIDRRRGVASWILDPTGKPRFAMMENDQASHWSIVGDDGELRPLPIDTREGARFWPLGVDGAGRLIVMSNHEGETTGVYSYDLDKAAFAERLFLNPDYDVSGVVWSRDGTRATAAYYADEEYRLTPIDPDYARRLKAVQALLKTSAATIVSESLDGTKVMATVHENGRRTETFFVDIAAGTVESLGRDSPRLDGRALGAVLPVSYKARDGLAIPAYVTLPPGLTSLEQAKGLPFVVMPHGGPHARDTADYDWWAQYTASLGYAVLQPNFRGSTGYGVAFREAGARQWGEAIQADVADGAAWLVQQGYADPKRLCVAGGSFGGYTALVAVIEDPDRYRCAVSLAGVSDLPLLIRNRHYFVGGRESMAEFVGRAWRDRTRLVENSPARRASLVAAPVLLVHGDADPVVLVSHSRLMRDRLKAEGKPFTYLELPLADHSMSREKDRKAFLEAYGAFLRQHLGEARPAA